MPHHDWSDDSFDWNGFNKAMHIVEDTCRFWKVGIHSKEKYGTFRCTPWFFDGSLHSFLWPAYVYRQWPKGWLGDKLWYMDIYVWPKIARYTGIAWLIQRFQAHIYNHAFQKALKAYPQFRDELLSNIDGWELVKGGREVHDKYWRSVKAD